jgi:hypothetical protein
VKKDPALAETALVQKIQLDADVTGQYPYAAAKQNWHDEQFILIDQPGPDGLSGQVRPLHRHTVRQLLLQLTNGLRVEFPLKARIRGGDRLQRSGIDDLLGRLPDPREVISAGVRPGMTSGVSQTFIVSYTSCVHRELCRWGASDSLINADISFYPAPTSHVLGFTRDITIHVTQA